MIFYNYVKLFQWKYIYGFEGAAFSLIYSVPSIAFASSLEFKIVFIDFIYGIFSNKNPLFCSMHSFSSNVDSNLSAASLPSFNAISN
jgi:hypothetical protein